MPALPLAITGSLVDESAIDSFALEYIETATLRDVPALLAASLQSNTRGCVSVELP